ncbi:MAG: aminopeptidase [Candidatus Aenigmatarchaeota archaeon]|nr:MAG: aminopeptidase [Candidatus Aenigmarchaeota archaeon]
MDIRGVARIVWESCIRAEGGEKALVLSDPTGERLEIAHALAEVGDTICDCELVRMEPTGMNGREPAPEVARMMLASDIVIAPTQYSITHTKASAAAAAKGAKVATLPGITKDMFMRAIPLDYEELDKVCTALKERFMDACVIRVTTTKGTDITMETEKGRKVCHGNGIFKPGKIKNLPDGEIAIAPKEGSSNGTVVFDLSSLNQRIKEPFRVEVKNGNATSCGNKELWDILSSTENGTNLAELGIGTNPKARVTGRILEDEKVRGTAHIAFGTNAELGGRIQTSIHLDSVFDRPTIEVDGKVIIKEGEFIF